MRSMPVAPFAADRELVNLDDTGQLSEFLIGLSSAHPMTMEPWQAEDGADGFDGPFPRVTPSFLS